MPSSVAAQNAARSAASSRATKSQPWLNPALGARTASRDEVADDLRGTAASGSNRRTMRRRRTASRSSTRPSVPVRGPECGAGGWHDGRHGGRAAPARATPRSGRPTSCCATAPSPTSGRSGPPTSTASTASTRAQSDESIYLRFFAPLRRLSDADVHRFTHVDYVDRVALVATMREDIIGIGRYDRIDARSAEVAFNISDHYQGKGIGSVLLEHLAAIAQEFGITRFTAEVLPQNRKMLSVFSDAGYDVTRHVEDGVVEVGFDIEPTDQSKAVAMSREHRAEALSVRSILHPRTIAVIGASRRRDSIGSQLLDRLLDAGFTGAVHPVNPNVRTLRRRTAYPSVTAVPGTGRPRRRRGPRARRARGRRRVRRGGGQGAARRVVGVRRGGRGRRAAPGRAAAPGARRGDARRRAQLLRADQQRPGGAAQRLARPDPARRTGGSGSSPSRGRSASRCSPRRPGATSGISTFASAGNRVDVSGNDLMQYWIDDDSTDAVGLYLESMGNPRKFSRIARNLALIKPVIVVKSGVSSVRRAARAPRAPDQGPPRGLHGDAQAGRCRSGWRTCTSSSTSPSSSCTSRCRRATGWPSSATPTALGTLTADACTSWGLTVTHGPVNLPSEATAAAVPRRP